MRDTAEEEDDQEGSAHMGYVSSLAIEQVWGKPKKKKKREGNERREIKITCMIMNSRPVLDAYWHSVSR